MKLADKVLFCAACHGQYLDRRHVDFEAFYDGPVIENEAGIKNTIDDLILCDKCLIKAGELIDLYPNAEIKKENVELGEAVERHRQEVLDRDEIISDMERTIEKLVDGKIQRPARKPKILVGNNVS